MSTDKTSIPASFKPFRKLPLLAFFPLLLSPPVYFSNVDFLTSKRCPYNVFL